MVRGVRRAIGIPLAVKLSPYFSSLANLAGQLVEAGANGLVLFNRFYQPDLDIEAMEVLPALELSSSAELRLPLRWIAILHRRWGISLAASTGVHTAEDVVKVLLAGADVAMMTSALLHNGPDHLRPVEVGLRDWMDRAPLRDDRPAPRPAEPALGPRSGRLRAGQLHQDPRLPHPRLHERGKHPGGSRPVPLLILVDDRDDRLAPSRRNQLPSRNRWSQVRGLPAPPKTAGRIRRSLIGVGATQRTSVDQGRCRCPRSRSPRLPGRSSSCPASLRRCAARLPAGRGRTLDRRNAVRNWVTPARPGGRSWAARFMRLRRQSHISS